MDGDLISQVYGNLMANAARYAASQIELCLEEVPVDRDAFERGEFLLTTEMNGNGLHLGDTMTFFVMDTDRRFQLPIGGQIPLERDGMNGGAVPAAIYQKTGTGSIVRRLRES